MRMRSRPRSPQLLAALGIFVAASCSDDLVAPTEGRIEVTTSTSGTEPDLDGYSISTDGGPARPIGVNANLTVSGLNPGSHQVTLGGLASNCRVTGDNPRSASVSAGGTVELSFAITCSAATGNIQITTATTGGSADDGYTVAVDNGIAQPIGANATVTVSNVAPGARQVAIGQVASNCRVAGDNPRPVSVTAGSKSTVAFDISCPTPTSSSRIAFLSSRDAPPGGGGEADVYLMDPDGSGVQRLTVGKDVLSFDWSPDGSRLVFSSFADEEIYAINVDGTGLVNLTNTPNTREREPDWSPDGSRIAFLKDDGIHVMNSDGSGARRLVHGADLWDWSPDGRKIAFLGLESLGRQRDFYVINVDGSGEANLTNTPQDHKQTAPSWSPDGQQIAFVVIPFGGDFFEIYVVNADGSGQKRLTNNAENDADHYWSPDGQLIAFSSDRDRGQMHDSREIYVMKPDGSGQTNLTNTPGGTEPSENDELPTGWSPDGSKILYERFGRIWVMNADGSGQTNLNQSGHSSAWLPK